MPVIDARQRFQDRIDTQNRFAARAKLLNETQDAQARRLAAATAQPPPDAQDLAGKPDQLARAWNYTPSPTPAEDFWTLHDQVLQQNLAQLGPQAEPAAVVAAHNDAETKALKAVYPYRADLAGIGTRVLEDQVAQAERIRRIVEGRTEDASA
jgi:hypothetical protein